MARGLHGGKGKLCRSGVIWAAHNQKPEDMQHSIHPSAASGTWQAVKQRSAGMALGLIFLLAIGSHTASGQVTGTPPFTDPTPANYVAPGLFRAGPAEPPHGYPGWYQDKTGVALELGIPLSQGEIDGAWVLTEGVSFPERFPDFWSIEHFYYRADAGFDIPLPAAVQAIARKPVTRARLVLAHESSWANEVPINGDQIVFTRIRVRIDDLPYSGTYVIYTPYDVQIYPDAVAGTRLFVTQDVGIAPPPATPEAFNLSLNTKFGPYLIPAELRDGVMVEKRPVSFEGRRYLANPGELNPVLGSPINQNYFRIVCYDYARDAAGLPILDPVTGQPQVVTLLDQSTDLFSMVGRLKTTPTPDFVKVNRATYFNSPTDKRVDLFATAEPTLPIREPGEPPTTVVVPELTFYPAPPQTNTTVNPDGTITTQVVVPAGVAGQPMTRNGSSFYAQSPQMANGVFPPMVMMTDGIGTIFRARVTDSIYVSRINYAPSSQTLSVQAISSDTVNPPVLLLTGVDTVGPAIFENGVLNLTGIAAVPGEVGILSSYGGYNTAQVAVGIPVPLVTTAPNGGPANLPPNNPANITLNVPRNQTITVDLLAGNSDPNDTDTARDLTAAVITNVNRNNYGRDFTVSINGITVPASGGRFPVPYSVASPLTFSASAARSYVFTFGLVDKAGARSATTATLTINVQ
jgi:hypothetical protein